MATNPAESINCTFVTNCTLHKDNISSICTCQCSDHKRDLVQSTSKCSYVRLVQHNCTNTTGNSSGEREFKLLLHQDGNLSYLVKKADLLPNADWTNISHVDVLATLKDLRKTLVNEPTPQENISSYWRKHRSFPFTKSVNISSRSTQFGRVIYDSPPIPIWVFTLLVCIGVIIFMVVTLNLYNYWRAMPSKRALNSVCYPWSAQNVFTQIEHKVISLQMQLNRNHSKNWEDQL